MKKWINIEIKLYSPLKIFWLAFSDEERWPFGILILFIVIEFTKLYSERFKISFKLWD